MPTSRIEGLLASFPKLIGKNDQHTFVETDSVRYVYQPLEQLFIVLITNKNSNILQDIDTLQLFSRIVSEYCRSSDIKEITRQRFELILVFDEVISLGHRENINLGQIKTISSMESNDERIQAEIQKNKEREAKEEAKRKAQMMDLKKAEARQNARRGISDMSSGSSSYNKFSSGGSMGPYSNNTSGGFGGNQGPSYQSSYQPQPSQVQQQPIYSNLGGRGMQLGKKSMQASLLETLKNDEGVKELEPNESVSQQPSGRPSASSIPVQQQHNLLPALNEEGVHVNVEEKISAIANRDGGLQNLEVNGIMYLKVNDPKNAKISVRLNVGADSNVQFKTHPKVDKQQWANATTIALRDPNSPYPISQPLPVLKWRYATKDESHLPFLVNCWPSPTGSGTCDVTVEYELQQPHMELSNVSIIIPFTGQVTQPGTAGIGSCSVDRQSSTIVWNVPSITSDSLSSGVLEFSMDNENTAVLYPIQIHFTSKKFIDLEVDNVSATDGSGSVAFSTEYSLHTDGYEIA